MNSLAYAHSSLQHTWVVPSLAAPLRSPEGFLDGRGLTSRLFCFLTLWVSRGRVGSQEETPGSCSIFSSTCFLLAALLQPGPCRSASVPCPLAPESSHSTPCCLRGPPAALRSLQLFFWNVLISHACGLILPFCPSGLLCDCGLPTQPFLMVLPHRLSLLLSGRVSSVRVCPASGTRNLWCLESAALGSVSPQPQKYRK